MASKMIKSRYGNHAITVSGNGKGPYARCSPNMKSRWWDMHAFDGNRIVNERGLTLDAYIDANTYVNFKPRDNKKVSQRWNLLYADEWKPIKTGTFVPEYGLHHKRTFVIQSQLPSRRLLSYVSSKTVIKTDVN